MGIELTQEVTTYPSGKLLRSTLVGDFEIYATKGAVGEVMLEAHKEGVRFLVVDMLGIVGDIGITDRFYLAEFASNIAVRKMGGQSPRIAVLVEQFRMDPERFGETVARNRGMDAKVFTKMDDALEWFGVK